MPGEECDCGQSWSECEDPCCYPATLTPADLAANSSALPCTRHQQVTCSHVCIHVYLCNVTAVQPLCTASPAATFWQYGLLAPFLAILLLALLGRYSTCLLLFRG